MAISNEDILRLLNRWLPPTAEDIQVIDLGNAGGFSGAHLWRVKHGDQEFCLRRWPEDYPNADRLAWIHDVLAHAERAGCTFLAVPLRAIESPPLATSGKPQTFINLAGHFWELSVWLPGVAHYPHGTSRATTLARCCSALAALAEFHRAAVAYPRRASQTTFGVSRGLRVRHDELMKLLCGGELETLAGAVHRSDAWPAGVPAAGEILRLVPIAAPAVLQRIDNALRVEMPWQPCLRDIWSAHVLFTGETVTGVIDYGAMQYECVAGDIARLLGSFAADDEGLWSAGMKAYERIMPLTASMRSLVRTFDQTQVLLGGIHWIRWIYQQRRRFSRLDLIAERLDVYLQRLRRLN